MHHPTPNPCLAMVSFDRRLLDLRNRQRTAQWLRDGDPTDGPFTAATGLGFAGFFFPLLQPMLGVGRNRPPLYSYK